MLEGIRSPFVQTQSLGWETAFHLSYCPSSLPDYNPRMWGVGVGELEELVGAQSLQGLLTMQRWHQASSAPQNRTAAPGGVPATTALFPHFTFQASVWDSAQACTGRNYPPPPGNQENWVLGQDPHFGPSDSVKLPPPAPDPISLFGLGSGVVQLWPSLLAWK